MIRLYTYGPKGSRDFLYREAVHAGYFTDFRFHDSFESMKADLPDEDDVVVVYVDVGCSVSATPKARLLFLDWMTEMKAHPLKRISKFGEAVQIFVNTTENREWFLSKDLSLIDAPKEVESFHTSPIFPMKRRLDTLYISREFHGKNDILFFDAACGLGNLLFNHATAYAFAREHGLRICTRFYYINWCSWYIPCSGMYRDTLFKHVGTVTECPVDHMFGHGQTRLPAYKPIPPETRYISGLPLAIKFFDKYKWEIRDLLRSNVPDVWASAQREFAVLRNGATKTVCIHVRGTDQLPAPGQHEFYKIIREDYYASHISKFDGYKCMVFSDDLKRVKKWKLWEGREDVVFVDEPRPVNSVFLMSLCDAFLLPASTFSLYAWHMRENKEAPIVLPENFYGPAGPPIMSRDLITA